MKGVINSIKKLPINYFSPVFQFYLLTVAVSRGIPTSGDAVPKGDKLLAGSRAAPGMWGLGFGIAAQCIVFWNRQVQS